MFKWKLKNRLEYSVENKLVIVCLSKNTVTPKVFIFINDNKNQFFRQNIINLLEIAFFSIVM